MPCVPFPQLDVLLCFPSTMLQQRGVAFSGILWHIYNKNQIGGYSYILRTAGRAQLMLTQITFLTSKSRRSIWKIVCWKEYLSHKIPAAGLGMVGKSPVWHSSIVPRSTPTAKHDRQSWAHA